MSPALAGDTCHLPVAAHQRSPAQARLTGRCPQHASGSSRAPRPAALTDGCPGCQWRTRGRGPCLHRPGAVAHRLHSRAHTGAGGVARVTESADCRRVQAEPEAGATAPGSIRPGDAAAADAAAWGNRMRPPRLPPRPPAGGRSVLRRQGRKDVSDSDRPSLPPSRPPPPPRPPCPARTPPAMLGLNPTSRLRVRVGHRAHSRAGSFRAKPGDSERTTAEPGRARPGGLRVRSRGGQGLARARPPMRASGRHW